MNGYLRPTAHVLDLAGVQTLLLGALHAGKHPGAAEPHGVDGSVIMEVWPVWDDLQGKT